MAQLNELNFLTTLLPLAAVVFLIAIGVILLNHHFHKNLHRQILAQEELKMLHQKILLKSNIEAQEKERKRLARDLHDELGAVLAILKMNVIQMELHEPAAVASVAGILKLVEAALTSARRISHELLPPGLDTFGLMATLESQASALSNSGMKTAVRYPDHLKRFSPELELGLYRIIMELINNTLKHANASCIDIEFELKDRDLVVRYGDDGNGFGAGNAGALKGLGLRNIESRMSMLGGAVVVGNRQPSGIQATMTIPHNN